MKLKYVCIAGGCLLCMAYVTAVWSTASAAPPPAAGAPKSGPATGAKPVAAAPSKPIAPAAKPAAPPATATSKSAAPKLEVDPLDWPNWRGPEQNGISRETGLIDTWDFAGDGENVLWKNPEAAGISTPIVMRGKLYTIVRNHPNTTREGEKVLCLDAVTGKKLWESPFNVYLSDVPAERVGWSCCVGDPSTGRIYAMGVCGYFQCLDGDTGETIWKRSLNEEFGLLSTYGGRTNVPVIAGDNVIISAVIIGWGEMARPAHRFLAFDKATGELMWFNGTKPLPEDTTYSTPSVGVLKGQPALVFGSGDGGVHAFQPRTGKSIWSFQLSRRGINVSPTISDYNVYIAHSEENTDNTTMGAIVRIDGSLSGDVTKTGEVWRASGMDGKSSPLLIDGRLYAVDDGAKLYIVDANTGKEVCKPIKLIGTIMRGSPLYADGKLYLCTTSAWHVLTPNEKGAKITHKLRLSAEDEVSGSPIVSHGRIYLPTGENLYCLGKADTKPQATARPDLPDETPASPQDEPALVQVTPYEVLLKPSAKQQYTVRLYNARGQFLRTSSATFSLQGPGEIDSSGIYTAASGAAHTATYVQAKVGDLVGTARIRVVPPLPWKFDFSDGEVPITWVGARYRHIVRDIDGNKAMVKITTIPKGTRSQALMGPTDLHDYTIQADVRGAMTNNKQPDMGVIAQRYTLDLMGASQQLQIRSWTPQLDKRFAVSVPIKWKSDTWYTIKFRAAVEGGKAVLRGKVWPRDEQEPAAWTVEGTDEVGNLVGSPGLWGNANDSEITIDNILVTPNS
jgi:outer membrane protein assembly factor BamB